MDNKDDIDKVSIKKIPYLSTSLKLFDEFILFGYSLIEKLKILSSNWSQSDADALNFPILNKKDKYKVVEHHSFPSILSSISNQEKQSLNQSEFILKVIFPNPPAIFLSPKNQITQELPEYKTIYFLNCDTNENNTKTLFYGFAYVFYEEGEGPKLSSFYFPKAICFISQYPFFSHYYDLAKTIKDLFNNLQAPIEFILYNIINHSIAPLNNSVNIEWVPEIFQGELKTYKAQFDSLSGYPIIDLDFSVLFTILPAELIIQIFIFSFLEKPMLFFSDNLEILNCTLYLVYAMHYPCTDSMYVWHLLSISEKDLLNEELKSSFVGKPFSSMMGVNCCFRKDIVVTTFSKNELFIVDIDNKKLYSQIDPDSTFSNFYHYLNDLLSKSINPTNPFEENVKFLFQKINIYSLSNERESNKKIKFDFFKHIDKEVNRKNKEIQEIFYSFVLNIIKPLYSFIPLTKDLAELKKTQEDIKSLLVNNKRLKPENIHEYTFYAELSEATKFSNYFLSFLNQYDTLDCYLISCFFSEEFLQMNNTIAEEFSFPHFEIIDSFFQLDKSPIELTLCNYNQIITKVSQECRTMKYSSRHIIQRFEPDVELKSSLIYLYNSILADIEQSDYANIFPASSINLSYQDMAYTDLSQHIEEIMMKKNLIGINYATSFGTMVLSLITLELMTKETYTQMFNLVLELLIDQVSVNGNQVKPLFLRKNISMYIKVIYYYIHKPNSLKVANQFLLTIYHQLLDLLVLLENHPNIDLMRSITSIDKYDNSTIKKDQFILEDIFIQKIKKKSSGTEKGATPVIGPVTLLKSKTKSNKEYMIAIQDNKCRDGMTKEEVIYQTMKNLSDNSNLSMKCNICQKVLTPTLVLRTKKMSSEIRKSDIFSPIKAYTASRNLFAKWTQSKLSFSALDKVEIKDLLNNLLFYQSKMDLNNSIPIINELFY